MWEQAVALAEASQVGQVVCCAGGCVAGRA
jgi:hypothetical protein